MQHNAAKMPDASKRVVPVSIQQESKREARREGPGRRKEEDMAKKKGQSGRGSILQTERPTKRKGQRQRWRPRAQKSTNIGRRPTEIRTPPRREEDPAKKSSHLAKKAHRRGICGMKLSSAVVIDINNNDLILLISL